MDGIKVSISCCVYNHERYLRKCLESLTTQITNFKYEIIIHDDASTDKSADIIREFQEKYPDIIKPIYQTENQYSKGVSPSLITLSQAQGEYIAICEGDDFWTSDDKLQKQVEFLDAHPDYSFCTHAAYYAHENGTLFNNKFFKPYNTTREVPIEEVIKGWKFATNSIMYRALARKELIIPFRGDCPNGDYALAVYLALNGKVYYINEFMSAYRAESVGSLNWVWRENLVRYVDSRKKYIAMLKRIDGYTNFKYTDIVKKNIDEANFGICLAMGDLSGVKVYKEYYNNLGNKQKFELLLHSCFPKTFAIYRKLIRKIKNVQNSI